ncbi:peptide deformylase [Shewanella surugensis]|uniref:Peptide deformylase n=1 Tax=Shewanella surugensis TaxID=212020 RepID=A0ABT0L6H2_9GAMM|nr:peptide deformylase [Shewanella surugensis]MCL1123283.1 peptide deformylase [Shewanella surugensis]
MLSIAQVGETVLTQKAKAVVLIDAYIHALADTMLDSLKEAKGVGLAAPQVHQSIALFIMASHPNERYPDAPLIAPTVVINPSILAGSDIMETGEEGCLSIKNKRFSILRHQWVDVRYQTIAGQWIEDRLTGFVARIFQHEYDHLQGITIDKRAQSQSSVSPEAKP